MSIENQLIEFLVTIGGLILIVVTFTVFAEFIMWLRIAPAKRESFWKYLREIVWYPSW
jgi:hypothetical protein